jgi:hypothetical protein
MMTEANTLTICDTETITAVKGFIEQEPGAFATKPFSVVINIALL